MKPHKFLLSVLLISAPAFCSQDTLDKKVDQLFKAGNNKNDNLQAAIFEEIINTKELSLILETKLKSKPSLFLKAAKEPFLFFIFIFFLPNDKPTEACLKKFWDKKSKFDGYQTLQNLRKNIGYKKGIEELHAAYVHGTIDCILHHEKKEQGEIISLFSQACAAQDYPMLLALLTTNKMALSSLTPLFASSFSDEHLTCLSQFYNTIKSRLSINSYEAKSKKLFRAFYIFLTEKLPDLVERGIQEQYSPHLYWEGALKIIECHKPCKKYTPLHFAAQNGHWYILPELIKAGAEYLKVKKTDKTINVQDSKGNTPLHYAVFQGSYKTVKFLLEAGASFYIKNHVGDAPLKGIEEKPDLLPQVKPFLPKKFSCKRKKARSCEMKRIK